VCELALTGLAVGLSRLVCEPCTAKTVEAEKLGSSSVPNTTSSETLCFPRLGLLRPIFEPPIGINRQTAVSIPFSLPAGHPGTVGKRTNVPIVSTCSTTPRVPRPSLNHAPKFQPRLTALTDKYEDDVRHKGWIPLIHGFRSH